MAIDYSHVQGDFSINPWATLDSSWWTINPIAEASKLEPGTRKISIAIPSFHSIRYYDTTHHKSKSWFKQTFNYSYFMWSEKVYTLWWTNILQWKITMLLMGKSTISMAIFHCYVSSPEGNHHSNRWNLMWTVRASDPPRDPWDPEKRGLPLCLRLRKVLAFPKAGWQNETKIKSKASIKAFFHKSINCQHFKVRKTSKNKWVCLKMLG